MKAILVCKLSKDETYLRRKVVDLARLPVPGEFIASSQTSDFFLVRAVFHYPDAGDEPAAEVYAVEADKREALLLAAGERPIGRQEEQFGVDWDATMASLDAAGQANGIKALLFRLIKEVQDAKRTGGWAAKEVEQLKNKG